MTKKFKVGDEVQTFIKRQTSTKKNGKITRRTGKIRIVGKIKSIAVRYGSPVYTVSDAKVIDDFPTKNIKKTKK